MPAGVLTVFDGGAGQQLGGQLVTHRGEAGLPEPGSHRAEAAAGQVQADLQERTRRAAVGQRGDQFLSLMYLACLQVPAGGNRVDDAPQRRPRDASAGASTNAAISSPGLPARKTAPASPGLSASR